MPEHTTPPESIEARFFAELQALRKKFPMCHLEAWTPGDFRVDPDAPDDGGNPAWDLLTAARKVLTKPPADPFGSLHPKTPSQSLTPQGKHSEPLNPQPSTLNPTPMTRLQTFGGAPAAQPIASTRCTKRTTAKQKCVKPDAKTKAAAHTAQRTTGATRTTQAGKRKPAKVPQGTTEKLIYATPAAMFAALSGGHASHGLQSQAIRNAFAAYAKEHNLDGHWRLHWNAFRASQSPSPQVSESPAPVPVAHVSREIAEAFGMDKLPANLVQIHDNRPLPPGLQPYFAGVKVGETLRFVPRDPRNRTVEGMVQDLVNRVSPESDICRALNIFCPMPGDPTRVLRVWADDGSIEPLSGGTFADEGQSDDSDNPTSLEHHTGKPEYQAACLRALGI